MKCGLIPSWTKRNRGHGGMLKTINCRSEGLASPGGMWPSMKGSNRCVVLCQNFYAWLKKGKDVKLICFAGLWDCCDYGGKEGKVYSYTIIKTEGNKQLNFLHDRMPVILDPGSKEMEMWLDPERYQWSKELQSCLKPYQGELEFWPVNQAVGKVGDNDPSFIVPVNSTANKNNTANFFGGGGGKKPKEGEDIADAKLENTLEEEAKDEEEQKDVKRKNIEHTEDNAPLRVAKEGKDRDTGTKKGIKHEHDESEEPKQTSIEEFMEPPTKAAKTEVSAGGRKTRSATHNDRDAKRESPRKKRDGIQKTTGFFEKK